MKGGVPIYLYGMVANLVANLVAIWSQWPHP
jgi:hypothetical protein